MTNYLPLVEKFHSLQGEGFHTGQSAFFIRLAGCNVGCSWCDTKYSWNKKKFPLIAIKEIIEEIKKARKKGAAFLVITGGEPLHHNLDDLCLAINKETSEENQSPIKIHIETSGVNKISGNYDWITLSPKRHLPPRSYFLKNCNELKIIINDQKDIDFAIDIKQEIMNKYKNLPTKSDFEKLNKKYYLQPAWENVDGFSLTIDFVKNNPEWNLSLQTHKYLKIK